MSEHEFKPNSHKYKEGQRNNIPEKKPLEKVVTGKVRTKKNEMRKLADIFIAEDIDTVKKYLLEDILVPTIRNTIVDMIINGAQIIFLGKAGGRTSRSIAERVSYSKCYKGDDRRFDDPRPKPQASYDDITVDSRGEAEAVIDRMLEEIESYGMVSIADLYQLVGITPEHTDYKYGWTDLRRAEVERVRDGYRLKLPRVVTLN